MIEVVVMVMMMEMIKMVMMVMVRMVMVALASHAMATATQPLLSLTALPTPLSQEGPASKPNLDQSHSKIVREPPAAESSLGVCELCRSSACPKTSDCDSWEGAWECIF